LIWQALLVAFTAMALLASGAGAVKKKVIM